jgi:two-component system OmpR family sensor kinase
MILLDNAVKVSPMGGEIRLQSQKTPEGLVFSVEDRGPGIPEEDLGRLFDRFFTHARADEDKGTGLGLSIAREIAARHGATLRAKNRAGGGAVFQMVFPESE